MRTLFIMLVFLLVCINLCYSGDDSIKELWRRDIYNWDQLKDTLKAKVHLTNRILIKDVNEDGKPEVIVATFRFPESSPVKGKILALSGVDGNPLWEQILDCGILALGEVWLENSPTIVALGDSVESYFLRPQDGKVLKKMTTKEVDYFNPLAISSAGDLAIITRRGGSLQMINPVTLEKKWEAKSENDNPSSEKNGFFSPVLVDINDDGVEDVVSVDYWPLRLVALDGRDGKEIWKTNLAKKKYKSDKKKKFSGDLVLAPPCVVDINSNGQKGVVVGTMGGAISIFSGRDGSKIFYSQVSHENPMKKEVPALFKLFLPKLPKGGIMLHLASADLNKDGFLEIIAACYDQRIYALDGKSRKELWEIKTDTYKQNHKFCQPAIADMDGDGNLDIVVNNSSGKLYCITGQEGSLLWSHHFDNGLDIMFLYLADVNGDGFIEVITPSTEKGEVIVHTTNAPCKPGEIIWGMPRGNPQNNPVVKRK